MNIWDLVYQLKEEFPGLKKHSITEIIKYSLQKQVPKEAEWHINGWRCPLCGCKRKERFSHCVACGQALKRTEIEIEPPKED